MKRTTRICAVLSLLAIAFAITIPSRAADDAGATFKAKCAMCHGADASGNTFMGKRLNIRNLASPEVQKQSDAELGAVITKGRDKMPAFGEKLTKDQIGDLVKHIRSLAKK